MYSNSRMIHMQNNMKTLQAITGISILGGIVVYTTHSCMYTTILPYCNSIPLQQPLELIGNTLYCFIEGILKGLCIGFVFTVCASIMLLGSLVCK